MAHLIIYCLEVQGTRVRQRKKAGGQTAKEVSNELAGEGRKTVCLFVGEEQLNLAVQFQFS